MLRRQFVEFLLRRRESTLYGGQMTAPWTPLTHRDSAPVQLREDVPVALETPLRQWLHSAARHRGGGAWRRVAVRCDLVLDRDDDESDRRGIDYDERLAYWAPAERLLEAVDALLDLLPADPAPDLFPMLMPRRTSAREALTGLKRVDRRDLQVLLDDARSRYTIRDDGKALVARVDPGVEHAVRGAIASGRRPERGSASEHLEEAFARANAVSPDPVVAYSEAIKAVECAAQATLQPAHRRATLGTMLGELPKLKDRLVFEIEGRAPHDGIEMLESMMALLWNGQTSRHGKQHPTDRETVAEAVVAVHIAAALVQFFSTGAIRRM
ncbi:hypothetical protein ACIRST_41230 [Kitasatospora sp. NPDC101447]|uniref:hypothetical protein n=1 Tax=Kitasatospora sp. NPDC101447 TaxID=3364102 RepID=UPI0038267A99